MWISPAYAAPAATGGFDVMSFLPMIVIFALFWFMIIRPQQKKMKEHKSMLDALQKGEEVVTSGGIVGKITKAGTDFLTIEIADGVEVVVERAAIGRVVEKGTLKNNR